MIQQPKITIGIPCYNAENSIKRAIESALAQDWENKEILVVDDCSTDLSIKSVNAICKNDQRVRLIEHTENTGVGGTRETIVKNALGEFIVFFDDDDESLSDRLTVQFNRIVSYEEESGQRLVACYASGQRKYPNGYVLDLRAIGSVGEAVIGYEVVDYLLLNERAPEKFFGAGTPTSALMARKSTFETVGSFDRNFRRVEDSEFSIRLGLKSGHFVGCREQLYTQYATKGSDKTAKANFDAELKLIEKNKDYLVSKHRYQYAKCWFKFRYYHFNKNPLRAFFSLISCWIRNPIVVTRHFLKSVPRRIMHEFKMGEFNKDK